MMYDAVVVGAGIEGSSASYQLAKKGKKNVLLLEQFDALHTRGSSHGQSRITRRAYNKPYYVQMMNEAFPLWSNLEQESGFTLYKRTGMLVFGLDGSVPVAEAAKSLASNGLPYEEFNGEEANKRYPHQLKLPANCKCVYERDGGILFANKALAAFQQQFIKYGGTLLDKHRVIEIVPGPVVTVVTNKASFQTKKLVIAAGAWTIALCQGLGVHLPFKVIRTEAHYWKVDNAAAFSSDAFPVFISHGAKTPFHSFGLPVHEYPGLIKICCHKGPEVDPDNRDETPGPCTVPEVSRSICETFHGVSSIPSITEYCMYTISPDGDPVIDKHPLHQNIVIAAGFSGHGFKLSPVVGKVIAELVMEENPSYDLFPFRLNRF